MELRVLAVGDVVGEGGLQCLEQHLRSLKKLYRIDFCVVNGENASGTGLTPKQADRMLDAGAHRPIHRRKKCWSRYWKAIISNHERPPTT